MFDGQHKTIASWMTGKQSVAIKLYLEIYPFRTQST